MSTILEGIKSNGGPSTKTVNTVNDLHVICGNVLQLVAQERGQIVIPVDPDQTIELFAVKKVKCSVDYVFETGFCSNQIRNRIRPGSPTEVKVGSLLFITVQFQSDTHSSLHSRLDLNQN